MVFRVSCSYLMCIVHNNFRLKCMFSVVFFCLSRHYWFPMWCLHSLEDCSLTFNLTKWWWSSFYLFVYLEERINQRYIDIYGKRKKSERLLFHNDGHYYSLMMIIAPFNYYDPIIIIMAIQSFSSTEFSSNTNRLSDYRQFEIPWWWCR